VRPPFSVRVVLVGGYELETGELSATAATYDDALTEVEARVPEGLAHPAHPGEPRLATQIPPDPSVAGQVSPPPVLESGVYLHLHD